MQKMRREWLVNKMCSVKRNFRKSVIIAFALPALLFAHPVDMEPDCD